MVKADIGKEKPKNNPVQDGHKGAAGDHVLIGYGSNKLSRISATNEAHHGSLTKLFAFKLFCGWQHHVPNT